MGECNRSYIVPRLETLFDNPNAITRVHIEPAVNFDRPAHYTQILARRKRCLENHHRDLRVFAIVRCASAVTLPINPQSAIHSRKLHFALRRADKHSEAMFIAHRGVTYARRPPLLTVL